MNLRWLKVFFIGVVSLLQPVLAAEEVKDFKNVVIIDVRTPGEYASGHVKSAINIDVLNPQFEKEIEKLDAKKTYAVYCRSGSRSRRAFELMKNRNLKVIDLGGFSQALEKTGLPCEGCH